jgi:predicted metal-dependent hydrolase
MPRQKVKKSLSIENISSTPFYPTVADCKRWTEILNQLIFQGTAPKYKKITVRTLRGQYAYCEGDETSNGKRYCNLTVHNKFDSFASFYCVLVHELIHLAEYHKLGKITHGDYFYSHTEMLSDAGIKLRTAYHQT